MLRKKEVSEIGLILSAILGMFFISVQFDFFESIHYYAQAHEAYDLDELVIVAASTSFILALYIVWRWSDFEKELNSRKAAEAEALQARHAAEEANRMKSEYLSNISHEIRSPLNAIMGFAQVLKDEIKDPDHLEYLDVVSESGETLLKLINDLLDLARIESGELELHLTPINLSKMLKDLERMFQTQLAQKGLVLNVSHGLSHCPAFSIDATRFRQILTNLLSNAVKFTDEGSISILVAFTETTGISPKIDLAIRVTDTGIGVTEPNRKRIFESFKQQQGQNSKKHPGSGLGLAISKQLALAMGGDLSYFPNMEGGSTFQLNLQNLHARPSSLKALPPQSVTDPRLMKGHILIADDNCSHRKMLTAMLSEHPFVLYQAENGKEALEMIQTIQFDLILMDNRMPEMTGIEVARAVKADPTLAKTPIIGISASVMEIDIKQYTDVFDAFVSKPINKVELINQMGTYLV